MSIETWKIIQGKVGVTADGIPGPATARAIAKALALSPDPVEDSLVRGTGSSIRRLVVHCTATREGQDIDAATIKRWHLHRGWSDIGYHFVIRLDGTIERGRAENVAGAHVAGFNRGSLGIVYVGGLDRQGNTKDTRTPAQEAAMRRLLGALSAAYPQAVVTGHRDLSPDADGDGKVEPHEWLKECPCFDVEAWWAGDGGKA